MRLTGEAARPALRAEVAGLLAWLIEVRRGIHRRPELGYQETRTSALVARLLRDLGLEVRTGVGRTGVVGLWRTGRPGPVLGLRADMDALPVTEDTGHEFSSSVPGVMHACGHDLHTAMLLGVAKVLAEGEGYRESLAGSVKFIFQPAEEGGGGAGAMIADGVLRDPPLDAVFAAHVIPVLEVGQVGVRPGPALASVDIFHVEVRGRGGHAAHPDLAADPLAPAAELVRRIKDRAAALEQALVAVTVFQAGTLTNIIPETALLAGTIRALSAADREAARDLVRKEASLLEKETGLKASVRLEAGYPMLVNDRNMTDLLAETAAGVVGPADVIEQGPSYGAEDMAYFLAKVPGSHFWLGCGVPGRENPAMLHSPRFDPDEKVMPVGVEVMVRLAERLLGRDRTKS
ncbi:MAG: M20 family metallopeptidase [Thermodesulfobacteriota bacterium]